MVEKDSLFQFKPNPIIHDKAIRQSVTPYHFTTMQCKFNACLQTDHPHTSFSLSPASPIQRIGGDESRDCIIDTKEGLLVIYSALSKLPLAVVIALLLCQGVY